MADHPNVTIARNAMEAFNKGDLETFAASLADDVVWHAPGNNRFAGERRGKQASLQRFQEQGQGGVTVGFDDIHDVLGNDEHVVAMLTIRFSKGDDVVSGPSVFVMHIRDGKLGEFWAMNADQAAVDALLG